MLVDDTDVVGGERVKILDFGIAKLAAEAQGISLKTRTGSVMGTPYYMSPEQCRGAGEVDKRSDIYSLGCILFEMACGRAPFQGEGFGDILGQHQYVAPPSPRLLAPHVPETLEAIILRALAKDPGARQQSMQELGAALGALTPAAGMTGAMATSRAATPASVPPQPLPMAVTTLGGAVGQVANGGNRKRSRTPLFALIGLVVVAGGATSFYLTRDGATQQPRAAAATPTPTPSPATVPTPSPTTAPTPSPTPAPTPSPTAASTTPSIPEPASDAVETMAPSPIAAAPPSPAPPTSATPEVTPSPQAALPAGPERLSKPAFVAGMTAIKDKVLACFDVSGLAIRVKLTVSPSGSVSSASVTPFVERHLMERMQAMEKEAAYSQVTRVREGELCAEAVVKKAKFPRFSGPPTKFSYEYAR